VPADAVEGDGITTLTSSHGASETLARLLGEIAARGLTLFAVIDHGGGARTAGLELRDSKVVIFGSPRGGTPAMAAAPTLALELPLRILIWQDGEAVRISFTTPAALADRFGLAPELAAPLAGVEAIARAIA
jgi:uncharacterized protein (DUF302 family)